MYGYDYYGYGHPMMWGGGFDIVGGIFAVVLTVLLIAVILSVVRYSRGMHGKGMHFHMGNSAMDILKERYAKGEIDKAEFEEKQKDLEK